MNRHSAAASLALLLACLPAAAGVVEVRVVGSDAQPLDGAVVFLESAAAKAAARPLAGVEVPQADKQFTVPVTVVTAGTEVHFPNRDKVRHHVYSFSPVKPFELKLYTGTPANPVQFDKPGIAVLGCNIHDQMVAWVLVVETPYHALSSSDGRVRLADVPPGAYRLRSWHPALPPGSPALDAALTVGAGDTAAAVQLPLAGTGVIRP